MPTNLKQKIQRLLAQYGLYHRTKASWLYDLYWAVADRSMITERRREVDFYRHTLVGLRAGDVIFDVGANEGFKTGIFLHLGVRVIAIDPDETNQEILRQSFRFFRLRKYPVTIVGKALSDRVGVETFWVNEPGSAKNTLNVKWVNMLNADEKRFGRRLDFAQRRQVQTTTLEELFREYGMPFFVKIDVEGHEAAVIQGMKTPVPYLSFEVNLPEFRQEAFQCLQALDQIDPAAQWNYVAECASGLVLPQWASTGDMIDTLGQCNLPSIEVFWKSETGMARLRSGTAARPGPHAVTPSPSNRGKASKA